jgi:hypothetical protein
MSKAVVGKFEVTIEADKVSVLGPESYVKSEHYKKAMAKILAGESAVINMAPPGYSLEHLIALALQTDYAAYLGHLEMMSWSKK